MQHYFQDFKLPDTKPEYKKYTIFTDLISFCLLQTILQMDALAILHEYIYVDEVGFSLTKTWHTGTNAIGQRVIINVPGQPGGNVTMCAAITTMPHLVLTTLPICSLFLEAIHNKLFPDQNPDPQQPRFVVL